MAASISSQLQAIKTALNASSDPEPGRRRPLTRPSVLFDAKTAADVDLDTILNLALSGLDVLVPMEERFRNFKNDLFSHQSKELDRELAGLEENKRIDTAIGSYLRLLSGYLESHSALKTLEYLIRRYRVHVYNVEDLILCALPYHDTHVFVQIVQLIDTGNTRWKFLDGVKVSGARLPREVIVQQCIRDMGVLEAICNYTTPVKKIQPSKHAIDFCTAVIFEVLGLVTVDTDTVKRILPYVISGLQPGARVLNQKAGALMIVSLLTQKAALAPNVVKSLMHSVADTARADAKETADFQWVRLSFMALVNIVQLQSVELVPKKTIDVLNGIRDISLILLGLNKEFNIDKFFAVFLDSLIEYSSSDELSHQTLLSIIDAFPMKGYVNRIVAKSLTARMKISKGKIDLVPSESGSKGKQILVCISEKYPDESRRAFFNFLKDAKLQPKKVSSSYEILCKILDDNLGSSHEIPDPKIFFSLEHSEPEIRRSAVLGLDVGNILREKAAGSKKFDVIQDAIFRRLYDDDLNVVLAVLELKNLTEIFSSSLLVEAMQHVLQRCIGVLLLRSSTSTSQSSDAAFMCLQQVITSFKCQEQYATTLAASIFPLILIQPKTQRWNLKALGFAKELKWPFYENLVNVPGSDKKREGEQIVSSNLENIRQLAETLSSNPEEFFPWLVKCYKSEEVAKTLFFLVLLQSLKMLKMDAGQFAAFFDSFFPLLKNEWEMLVSAGISTVQANKRLLDGDCRGILEDLLVINIKELNSEILPCLFLRLLEAFAAATPGDATLGTEERWMCMLQDLFLFFASHSKDVFKKHLEYLFTKCKNSVTQIMSKLLTEEGVPYSIQVENLHSLSHLCSQLDEGLALQLLPEFASILVPLSSDNQDVRMAAMICVEDLFTLWSNVGKNGSNGVWLHFLGELLFLIIQQKKMILSDQNILSSLFTSLLGSSSQSILLQQSLGTRFDESTKNEILVFMLVHALGLSAHAKLKILSLLKGLGSKVLSVSGVKSLLKDLLERRDQHYLVKGKLCQRLSHIEVDILCLLLESCTRPTSSSEGQAFEDFMLKALQVNGAEDSAAVEPCLTILRNMSSSFYGDMKTETQDLIFRKLLVLFRSSNADIQNATRDTLLRINLNCSVVRRILVSILDQKVCSVGSVLKKKKQSANRQNHDQYEPTQNTENILSFISAFLDVLLMKKNIDNRTSLIGPLFKLLHLVFMNNEWMLKASDQHKALKASDSSQNFSDTTAYIQQTVLSTLEDISASIVNETPVEDTVGNFDLQLLVNCARGSSDAITRNHVFSLITTIAKIMPDKVLDHILDILTAIAESTTTQWDSYSQRVFEGLISVMVPYWLSKTGSADQLLQIFVNILPQVAEHRRLSIITYILRTLTEHESLGSLLFLLFHSLVSRKSLFSLCVNVPSLDQLTMVINKQWEYEFGVQLCGQYSCTIWLRSLIVALKKIGSNDLTEEIFMEMLVAMQFVSDKLRDPEIAYRLDSGEDINYLQTMVGDLMEQVVSHLQLLDFKKTHIVVPAVIKNELKEFTRSVLKTITNGLLPSTYFEVIIKLIDHVDRNVRKKALGLLCETVKDFGAGGKTEKKGLLSSSRNLWLHLDETSLRSFEKLCSRILALLDTPDDVVSTSLKLAALSALEVLSNRFPSSEKVFALCLGSVCKGVYSENSALSCHCLRATGALVSALGPKALPELPNIMEHILRKSRDFSSAVAQTKTAVTTVSSKTVDSLFMSILLTLEAVIIKLGGFLNPYLGDILRLVVLHPLSVSNSGHKLKLKADGLRKLITDKIPVRLLIPPVLELYSDAIKSGESSLSIVFEMLGNLVGSMDRSSVGAYHAKIFDLCLLALDLRRQNPTSIQNIDVVEQNVINAVVTLTMKLTEPMFRPLFIKTIEWSGLNVEDSESIQGEVNGRTISFYSLINKLAESHRSLFVPYFKYLLDGFVRGLGDVDESKVGLTHKKKKVKSSNNTKDRDGTLSLEQWHLRSLILSLQHKCFLYDTGSSKFLDSSNFHVLLKPIVSQLAVDPPVSIEDHPNVPSVREVDDLLVACVGQMAVTAGSDLLWKPLNHEVLMQTRCEKIRARILGLRIIKYLVENLKEEYLVFLPETIPFLGELLEDVELPVKTLAQEILKEMESMSGESLREYL